jgi:hypothetical protein
MRGVVVAAAAGCGRGRGCGCAAPPTAARGMRAGGASCGCRPTGGPRSQRPAPPPPLRPVLPGSLAQRSAAYGVGVDSISGGGAGLPLPALLLPLLPNAPHRTVVAAAGVTCCRAAAASGQHAAAGVAANAALLASLSPPPAAGPPPGASTDTGGVLWRRCPGAAIRPAASQPSSTQGRLAAAGAGVLLTAVAGASPPPPPAAAASSCSRGTRRRLTGPLETCSTQSRRKRVSAGAYLAGRGCARVLCIVGAHLSQVAACACTAWPQPGHTQGACLQTISAAATTLHASPVSP